MDEAREENPLSVEDDSPNVYISFPRGSSTLFI